MNLLSDSSLLWTKSSSTITEWYQNSCAAASQNSKCSCECNNNHCDAFADGSGYDQDNIFLCYTNSFNWGCLPRYLQDCLGGHHLCLRYAPFWYWRSLRHWWCSGNFSRFTNMLVFTWFTCLVMRHIKDIYFICTQPICDWFGWLRVWALQQVIRSLTSGFYIWKKFSWIGQPLNIVQVFRRRLVTV